MNKFVLFEKWLKDNGAEFSMVELKSYDDGTRSSSTDTSLFNSDADEEKKETFKETLPHHDPYDKQQKPIMNQNIDDDSEMRGVHAKISIPPNTICVSIPRKCLITVEMGQSTEIGQIILNSDLDLDAPKHIFLMIFLLWDRKVNGTKSFFYPYYNILPKTLSNIPIFWSQEELLYLEGSYILEQIADRDAAITDDYYSICEVAPQLAQIATLDEFKWARMCVCSRNFGLQIDGHRTSALVPHADMFNHYRPRETKWTYDDELEAFTITTLQTIQPGSQIYDSYGQKCNHRFLLNYGFAVEDNRELDGFCPNEVPIELQIPLGDELFDAKYEIWVKGESDIYRHNDNILSNSVLLGGDPTNHHDSLTAALTAVVTAAASGTTRSDHVSAIRSALDIAAVLQARKRNNNNARSRSISSDSSHSTLRRIRVCISNNENTKSLFSMLRVLVGNKEELEYLSSSTSLSYLDHSHPLSRSLRGKSSSSITANHTFSSFYRTCRDIRLPICLRNEKAAMQLLQELVSDALDSYPTTLDQDLTDLLDEERYPRYSNKRHAKIQVRGEKEVLHHFAAWSRTALGFIDLIEKDVICERENLVNNVNGDSYQFFDAGVNSLDTSVIHPTIFRYCYDVLGTLRREELIHTRRAKSPSQETGQY